MIGKIKEITGRMKHGSDWSVRMIVAGAVSLVLISALVIISNSLASGRASRNFTVESAEMLSAWLAERNLESLSSGRPELSHIETIEKHPGVMAVMIFGADGRLFAPLSMHGEHFADKEMFSKIVSGKRPFEYFNNQGIFEIFRPVVSSSNGHPGDVCGVVYLALKMSRSGGAWHTAILVILIAALIALLVYWVIRDTYTSIAISTKNGRESGFEFLNGHIRRLADDVRSEACQSFEAEWRKLIHAMSDPVFVLDDQCRLKELNEGARRRFDKSGRVAEGTHIIDLLKGDDWQGPVISLLGELAERRGSLVTKKGDGLNISAFTSGSRLVDFKYTLVFSEEVI